MNSEERKKLDALVKRVLDSKEKPQGLPGKELSFTLDEFVEKVLMPKAQKVGLLMRFDKLIEQHETRMKKETSDD